MAIQLDHAIVPSHNRVAAAQSLAGLLGVPWQESQGSFSPVYVNEALTLDFADRDRFEGHHVCFRVDDAEFDAIFGRIQGESLAYGSGPMNPDNMKVNEGRGGKRIYFRDPSGHLLELLTVG